VEVRLGEADADANIAVGNADEAEDKSDRDCGERNGADRFFPGPLAKSML